jgi:hypothetical protein
MNYAIGSRVRVGAQRQLATIVAWPDVAFGPNYDNRVPVVIDGSAGVTTHTLDELWTTDLALLRTMIYKFKGPFTIKNVLDAVGEEFTRTNVDVTLHRMVEEKAVMRIGRGLYQII